MKASSKAFASLQRKVSQPTGNASDVCLCGELEHQPVKFMRTECVIPGAKMRSQACLHLPFGGGTALPSPQWTRLPSTHVFIHQVNMTPQHVTFRGARFGGLHLNVQGEYVQVTRRPAFAYFVCQELRRNLKRPRKPRLAVAVSDSDGPCFGLRTQYRQISVFQVPAQNKDNPMLA